MHRIGRGAGTMQAGCHSSASTLDFGVRAAPGQAADRWLHRPASDEERQMTQSLPTLALRVQDRAC